MDGVDDEDVRREAAISSKTVLRPNFNSKGVTQDQLFKFKELHRKRLQLKSISISKFKKKPKDGTGKFPSKSLSHNDFTDKDSSVPNSESQSNENVSLVQPEIIAPNVQRKQPLKLHWGLDEKERWERRSNM